MSQMLISISREFGSAGYEIGELVAKHYGIKFYDRGILNEVAVEKGVSREMLEAYDEKPKNPLWVRKVGEFTNSNEEHIANMQFDIIKEKASSGESFVIVGRCADHVLKGNPSLVTFFITGDEKEKIAHIMEKHSLTEKDAKARIEKENKRRKAYHADYAKEVWGEAKSYDLTINSSRLGIEKSAEIIEKFIDFKFGL